MLLCDNETLYNWSITNKDTQLQFMHSDIDKENQIASKLTVDEHWQFMIILYDCYRKEEADRGDKS